MNQKNQIFEDKGKKGLKGNDIFQIINSIDIINKIYEENNDYLGKKYNINKNDKKIMNFILRHLSKHLKNNFLKILLHFKKRKIICKENKNINNINIDQKKNLFISNFIIICMFNFKLLSKYCNIPESEILYKILKITQIIFLNDLIDETDLKLILGLQICLCYYNENKKSQNIVHLEKMYLVIDFLIDFCNNKLYQLSDDKIKQIISLINFTINILKQNILINYEDICLLSRSKSFFKLIQLCQITSYKETDEIISLLVEVYKFKFNIDFIFNDLSEQFLYKIQKDILLNKTKLLIAKNSFLNIIFKKEAPLIKGEIIKNGFYFSDFSKNGIECTPINIFPSKNDGYSLVVSFKLMNNKTNSKFTIFSMKDKFCNIMMNVYIEDCKLKIKIKKEKERELNGKISLDKSYILWIIQTKSWKHKMIIYLNENKTILSGIYYPVGNYKINIGCNIDKNNIATDNFIGIIGTFILFNKCLVKDEKDFRNITKLIELKGNYEGITYADCKKEWNFVDKDINLTLNLLSNSIDKNKDIELIISSKSLGNDNLIYNSKNILGNLKNGIHCNYFQNSEVNPFYYFRNTDFLKNNKSFPLYSHNSFFDFLNQHGFLYLQLELYYLISVISIKIEDKISDKKNIKIFNDDFEEEDFYTHLTQICTFFFFCIDLFDSSICFNSKQTEIFQKEIDNFKYTLIDLVTILNKYNCKIKIYFLALLCQKMKEKKYSDYCSFILNIELYETADNQIFNAIFSEINHILKDEYDNSQIQTIFMKLIEYDKLYIMENIDKSNINEYSKIMRLLLKTSINENLRKCYNKYKKRLKQLITEFSNNNLINDISNIQEEDYNNGSDNHSKKFSLDLTNHHEDINIINDIDSRKWSDNKNENSEYNINNEKGNKKNLNCLILIYKYLKNLYISINDNKNKFILFFEDKKKEFSDFFNNLFISLERVYPIENKYSEKMKKEVLIAEYIKSLCIRFLDDFFFKDNLKTIKDEEDKLKNKGEDLEELDNKSTGNLKRSNNSAKTFIRSKNSYGKANSKGSFIGSSTKNLDLNTINSNNTSNKGSFISFFNISNKNLKEILTEQMEFFDDFILSPYTYRSFFLMLFREYPNDKKIKFIKDKKKQKFDFIMDETTFPQVKYLLKVIYLLLENKIWDENDTFFMTKEELIIYTYQIFSELLKKNLEYYLKKEKNQRKKDKSMIKGLFVNQKNNSYADKFFNIIISNISEINQDNEKFLNIVLSDMKELIKDSIFSLKDPFYFKTLRDIFYEKNEMTEFVFNLEIFIMEKINEKLSKKEKNNKIEINSKNTLILLYKTIFYINKRNELLKNETFIKAIFLFLSGIMDHSSIIYTKILFPIEESRGKILFEIIYEIIFEFHLEFLRNPKMISLQISVDLLTGLFNENKLITNLGADLRHFSLFKDFYESEEEFTPFYIMDKLSEVNYEEKNSKRVKIGENIYINKYFFQLRNKLFKNYGSELKVDYNLFSACILFSIKIILSIKELHEYYSNNKSTLSPTDSLNSETNNSDGKTKNTSDTVTEINEDNFTIELKNRFIILCKNIQRMNKEIKNNNNPFKLNGYYSKNIFEHYRSFILEKINFNNDDFMDKIYELIEKVNTYRKNDLKFVMRVIYTSEGRTILYEEKKYKQILDNINKTPIINDTDTKQVDNDIDLGDKNNFSDFSSYSAKSNPKITNKKSNFSFVKSFNEGNLKNDFYLNINSYHSQKELFKRNGLLNKSFHEAHEDKIFYESRIKFKKDLMRKYFSLFFGKLLNYDEDFINIKKIYSITYGKEIADIDKYNISYPTRIKNYICNNYDKLFLKRDFDFFTEKSFIYSHNYLYKENNKYNYSLQNKLLFPNKKLLRENDSLYNEIFSKNINQKITTYSCEMITVKGSIFGNIYIFENCLFYQSELANDKRKILNKTEKDYEVGLLFVRCTLEYDFLKVEKKIIMEFNDIKEVIERTFVYNWIALEIYLKDGRSFLFNLFNEEAVSDLFDIIKQQKIPIIRRVNEYYKKEELTKKWKEEKITTYDYLLLLNKLSSRSYNDSNQYLVMPWLFLTDGIKKIRNFDLPISVQDDDTQKDYLSKGKLYLSDLEALAHGNHYSTSAYLCFYLMRTNPFTNIMIRFQSNSFDVPDRQYTDIKSTINLCQNLGNNRELIPELFSIPEIYINLNNNDFGKQKEGLRIHNISFQPYAENPFHFCYLLKDLLNNNDEINNKINRWFDFIFGINQLGNYTNNKNMSYEEREKYRYLRKFNTHCYGKLFNYKKVVSEARKHCKNNKSLYDDIRNSINLITSFGQCPYQLLTEAHPIKNKYISNSLLFNYNSKNNYQFKTNIFDETFFDYKNDIHNMMNYNKNIEDISRPIGKEEIVFFTKSSNNNYLYCLLKNGTINVYRFDIRIKNFILEKKEIKPKCKFLTLKENKNKLPIFQLKYLFCEINENSFIFGRTLDRTLIYYNFIEDFQTSFLFKSYTISIISIKNNEFITGNDNGQLCKWKINVDIKEKKVDLELLLLVKSNQNAITSLYYDERLNIIASGDTNTLSIRKLYDFEYLNSIRIQEDENKYISDIKISDFNFIYLLVYVEDKNIYELQGYTLNGTYFGKYVGALFNFQISKTGKLLVNEMDKDQLIINVLNPVNFTEIHCKEIITKEPSLSFHFYFERPNIIYDGIKDKEYTRIKIMFLYPEEKNIFYMNDIC